MTRRARLLLGTLGLMSLVLLAGACYSAWRAQEMPFPSLLIDGDGYVTGTRFAGWGTPVPPVHHGDEVIAVQGEALAGPAISGRLRAQRIRERIAALYRQGNRQVDIEFAHRDERFVSRCPIRTLGPGEIWFFGAIFFLMGLVHLWSGLFVLLLAGRHDSSLAYGLWSTGMFVNLVTFFDHNTLGLLSPLFRVSLFWNSLGCFWAAYAFPHAPAHQPFLRRAMLALTGLVLLGMGWVLAVSLIGLNPHMVRGVINFTALSSLVIFAAVFLLRLRSSTGRQRDQIRSVIRLLALAPASGLVIYVNTLVSDGSLFILAPFVLLIVPIAVQYALIQKNVLSTTAVLTQRMLIVPVVLGALLGGSLAWFVTTWLVRGPLLPMVPALSGIASFLALLAAGRGLLHRHVFAAASQFRPTIMELGDQLAQLTDRDAIENALRQVVARRLPGSSARTVPITDLPALCPVSPDAWGRLQAGQPSFAPRGHGAAYLLVPMSSCGELRSVLVLAQGPQAALYTSEDLVLLDAIASFGALALRHAEVLGQVEAFRRIEVAATRDEKKRALSLVSAEDFAR